MTTTLFINDKLVMVKYQEKLPKGGVFAILPKDTVGDVLRGAVRDAVYTLKREGEGWIFRCTQSPFKDNSGLNLGYNGHKPTIGEAIYSMYMICMDFKFTVGQLEFNVPLDRDIPVININEL